VTVTREIGFGFGSNVGDKVANLHDAQKRLFGDGRFRFLASSSVWRSAPWGYTDQDWFANCCAVGETELTPEQALMATQGVEAAMGRLKTFRWGPRAIDVDILYLGDAQVVSETLIVPHKEMFNRSFVLAPLAEIRPDLVLNGVSICDASEKDREGLSIIGAPWRPGAEA
jgi:2-amino-4-hydroxy-6-hydroxymethyldihydropteridine diphosphokinase